MIVWRVRGKIIGSLLCNIVCSSCAQCIAHVKRPNSCLVVRFYFSVVILCVSFRFLGLFVLYM